MGKQWSALERVGFWQPNRVLLKWSAGVQVPMAVYMLLITLATEQLNLFILLIKFFTHVKSRAKHVDCNASL